MKIGALFREAVEVGCLDELAAVTRKVTPPEVIRENEDDIGKLRLGCGESAYCDANKQQQEAGNQVSRAWLHAGAETSWARHGSRFNVRSGTPVAGRCTH
jgi:hypothetical protein